MKSKLEIKIVRLGNAIRNMVVVKRNLWQQPETVGLHPVVALTQNQSSFSQSKFFAKGIPFSPLND